MKYFYLLLLVFSFSTICSVKAQEVNISLEKWNAIQKSHESSIDSLNRIIKKQNYDLIKKNISIQQKDSINRVYQNAAKELQEKIAKNQVKVKYMNDSIISLEAQVHSKDSILYKLKSQMNFADTCIARLANGCLYDKYDPKRIEEASSRFDKIHSPQIKKYFSELKLLLNSYKTYYEEIIAIINNAQNDQNLKDQNPFNYNECSKKYIAEIKSTEYYKKFYSSSWTIPYLNGIINKVIKKLSNNSSKKKIIDFKDILDE